MRILRDVAAGVLMALTWLAALLLVLIEGMRTGSVKHLTPGWLIPVIVFGPLVIAFVTTYLSAIRRRAPLLWAVAGAIAVVALPVFGEKLLTNGSLRAPMWVAAQCPTPEPNGSSTGPSFPLPRSDGSYGPGLEGGGGIPDDFTAVKALRCTLDGVVRGPNFAVQRVTVHGESATGDFGPLVRALRQPSATYAGCGTEDDMWPQQYVILINAQGTALLAGFPTDRCGAPQSAAEAALVALDWQPPQDQIVTFR